jgi:hypothetical protein
LPSHSKIVPDGDRGVAITVVPTAGGAAAVGTF